MEFAQKKSGAGSGVPNDIIYHECYGSLLDGPSIARKNGSTNTPSVRQIELGKSRKTQGGNMRYAPGANKTNAVSEDQGNQTVS